MQNPSCECNLKGHQEKCRVKTHKIQQKLYCVYLRSWGGQLEENNLLLKLIHLGY